MTSYDLLYHYIRFTFYVRTRTHKTMYITTVECFKLFIISQHDCKILLQIRISAWEIHFFSNKNE